MPWSFSRAWVQTAFVQRSRPSAIARSNPACIPPLRRARARTGAELLRNLLRLVLEKEDHMAKKAKKQTSRGRKQDRARVAGGQDHEVRYKAKRQGVRQVT